MIRNRIAILIYGIGGSNRNALTEEKYAALASSLSENGFEVRSIIYNDEIADKLSTELLEFAAVLVWVNPIEQGNNRVRLDQLLNDISYKGVFVSTHPKVILKMGTKDVLYKTRDMDWGSRINMFETYEDFEKRFPEILNLSVVRVLKQYRGNGGNGVFKIIQENKDKIKVVHAKRDEPEVSYDRNEFYKEFKPFFSDKGLLIDQPWNEYMINGMVRCYLSGNKVVGFGYQEINSFYELDGHAIEPSKRYYFTENCGLFRDLRDIMEKRWVPELKEKLSIETEKLPLIWDADFFINLANSPSPKGKYTLCEINVSCVSPFPPSAIKYIVENLKSVLS